MRYDYCQIFSRRNEKGEDEEILYARGLLTIQVFGLAKTNQGKLFIPTYKIDEQGNMQNFFFKDGKPLPLYSFNNCGKEELVNQPEMIGKTKEKKFLLWCQQSDGKNTFFRLEAWENTAKKINMFYESGDEVTLFANKVISKGAENGKSEIIWNIQDISKIKKDFITRRGEKVKKEKEEIGLPFN